MLADAAIAANVATGLGHPGHFCLYQVGLTQTGNIQVSRSALQDKGWL